MTVLVVIEQEKDKKKVESYIREFLPDSDILCFNSSLEALAVARKQEVDIAFIAVEMSELGGLDLGRYLTDLYPFVNVIFLSKDETISSGFPSISNTFKKREVQ